MDNGTRNSMGETVYSSDDASAVMSEKVKYLRFIEKSIDYEEEGGACSQSVNE